MGLRAGRLYAALLILAVGGLFARGSFPGAHDAANARPVGSSWGGAPRIAVANWTSRGRSWVHLLPGRCLGHQAFASSDSSPAQEPATSGSPLLGLYRPRLRGRLYSVRLSSPPAVKPRVGPSVVYRGTDGSGLTPPASAPSARAALLRPRRPTSSPRAAAPPGGARRPFPRADASTTSPVRARGRCRPVSDRRACAELEPDTSRLPQHASACLRGALRCREDRRHPARCTEREVGPARVTDSTIRSCVIRLTIRGGGIDLAAERGEVPVIGSSCL